MGGLSIRIPRSVYVLLASLFVAALPLAAASAAHWEVINLHPPAYAYSDVLGVGGGTQVGRIYPTDPYNVPLSPAHAALWSGTAQGVIDLTPAGCTDATAMDTDGNTQVGYITTGGLTHAGLWHGTAASWLDLNPSGATQSSATAVFGNSQFGRATFGGNDHAMVWQGGPEGLDINPAGATQSAVLDVYGDQQAGSSQFNGAWHAGIWAGSAGSWTDLNPSGSTGSEAVGTSGSAQAGYATVNGRRHAALWHGTASSWIDLNPTGYTESYVYDMSGAYQTGIAIKQNGTWWHAALWNSSAESWLDLATLLPSNYTASYGNAIQVVGGEIWVGGSAYNNTSKQMQAIVWHYLPDVPEPSSLAGLLSGMLGAGFLAWRRRR